MGYYYDTQLYHHGIPGQKWGDRNGPPYPLDSKEHNDVVERKEKKGLTDKQKKVLKTSATIVAACLVAYGGYKLATSPKARSIANNILQGNKDKRLADLDKEIASLGPEIVKKNDFGGASKTIGKSIKDLNSKMIKSINADGWTGNPPRLKEDYARNCSQTSIAYVMNSVLGKDVTAKGFGGVDEISGMLQEGGRHKNVFGAVFDGINTITPNKMQINSAINNIPSGSTGIIRLQNQSGMGHFINYEKTKTGVTTFIDCQTGKVFPIKETNKYSGILITDIFDCSNVSIRDSAKEYLKYMINS